MTILGGLIQNASFLLALVFAHSLFVERLPRGRLTTRLLSGTLFGATAVVGMIYPVTLLPGVFFDARTVILSMAGLFGGPVAAAVAALIAAAYRSWVGGAGAAMGVGTIVTAAILGSAFHLLRRRGKIEIDIWTLAALGLMTHVLAMAWTPVLPTALRAQVLSQVALPYLVVLPLLGVLLGLLLRMQEQRIDDALALRESRARLDEAQRIARLGYWEWDLRADTHHWSEETDELLGRAPALPRARSPEVSGYFTADSWARLSAAMDKARADGQAFECDAEVIRPDESRRWATVRGEAVRDHSGEIASLRGTVQDVTERKAVSDALARERAFFVTLIQAIPDLVWLKDPDGVYLACNPRFERFFGATEAQIKGRTDRDFVPDEQAVFFRRHDLNALAAGGPTINEETITFAADGHRERLETIKTPMHDTDGRLIGILGIGRNITPQHEAREALRRERDRIRAILETVEAFILVLDLAGRIELINRKGCQTLGYTAGELEGKDWFEISTPPDQPASTARAAYQAACGGDGQGSLPYQASIRTRDGRERRISWRNSLLHDDAGQIIGTLSAGEDVTEREELHARIEKLAAHIPGVIYQYRQWPDGRAAFPYASQGIEAIYGVTPAEVVDDAKPVFGVIHPDDLDRVKASIGESMKALAIWHEQYRVRFPDGRTIWVEGESSPERQADGSVLWHGHIRDVTERRRVESEAQAMRAKLESALAAMSDAIIISDAAGNLVHINEAFATFHRFASVQECAARLDAYPDILDVFLPDGSLAPLSDWAIPRALRGETAVDQEYRLRRKDTSESWVGSYNLAPIRDGTGRIVGSVVTARDITEAKAHEAQLDQIANYDHLTGAPNRRLLTDRLGQAIARTHRHGGALAVCYLDLDGFKPLNDRYGHAVGDELLVHMTKALQQTLREEDTIARLGGDEFVLLLVGLARPEDCPSLLDRILATVRTPIRLMDTYHSVSASIGVTLCPPDVPDPDGLLRHADQAMYRAKETGGDAYHLYDAEQDRLLRMRRLRLDELWRAVRDDELRLYFQPQVDLISRKVLGVEALLRWQHPDAGLLAPADFLPDTEGSELEVAVGEWVLRTAMRQCEQWKRDGQHLRISVNIGAHHLLRPDFTQRLGELLATHSDVGVGDLALEILETAALSDFKQAQRALADSQALGVRFALDDFGTGYSSLAYFRMLPLDVLKIDKSFVCDMLDDPCAMDIVRSVVQLSRAFDRSVIAEGVETSTHAALLTWLGCRSAQGYGIAKPMPASKLPAWLAQWSEQNGWSDLDAEAQHDEILLMVAAQNHLFWLHAVVAAIEQPDLPRQLCVEAGNCPFERWYGGAAASRYGRIPAFREIGRSHTRAHAAAERLLCRTDPPSAQAKEHWLRELYCASDELIAGIKRLAATDTRLGRVMLDGDPVAGSGSAPVRLSGLDQV
jgi:diguanylate cyclase (GGDEF)-like protein/PAS domain S-box-containing protein